MEITACKYVARVGRLKEELQTIHKGLNYVTHVKFRLALQYRSVNTPYGLVSTGYRSMCINFIVFLKGFSGVLVQKEYSDISALV